MSETRLPRGFVAACVGAACVVVAVQFYGGDNLLPALGALASALPGWYAAKYSFKAASLTLHAVANRLEKRVRADLDASLPASEQGLKARWESVRAGPAIIDAPTVESPDTYRGLLEGAHTRGLMIVGAEGAGKTAMLNRLAYFATGAAEKRVRYEGDPVPVVVSADDWNPEKQSLRDWLSTALPKLYPFLDVPEEPECDWNRALGLFERGWLLVFLDGLDEMPSAYRDQAAQRIKGDLEKMRRRAGLVFACREPATGVHGFRTTAIPSLGLAEIGEFLREGTSDQTWWAKVLEKVEHGGPIREVLSRPLMLSLTRIVYREPPQCGRQDASNRPDLLCELHEAAEIKHHILERLIPAVYLGHHKWCSSKSDKAKRWLTSFAGQLSARKSSGQGSTSEELRYRDWEWWRLRGQARWVFPLVIGGVAGVMCGLAAGFGTHVGVGFGIDLGLGIGIALMTGEVFWRPAWAAKLPALGRVIASTRSRLKSSLEGIEDDSAIKHFWQTQRRQARKKPSFGLAGGLLGGSLGGLVAGFAVKLGIGHNYGLADSLAAGMGIGVGAGPSLGLTGGFVGSLVGGSVAGLLVGVGTGLPAGIVNGLGVTAAVAMIMRHAKPPEPARKPAWHPIGIAGGLAAGLVVGATAWVPTGRSVASTIEYAVPVAVAAAFASGLFGEDADIRETIDPRSSLREDRRAFGLIVSAASLAVGLTTVFLIGLNSALELRVSMPSVDWVLNNGLLTGLAVGLTCGIVLGCVQTAWPAYFVTRCWLAITRRLPWRLMQFLEDAQKPERAILIQAGPTYRFRHKDLQSHLESSRPRDVDRNESAAGESGTGSIEGGRRRSPAIRASA